ncbi:hypothetical protein H0H93_004315 [Arthromyces matolae]|nr:hypothetical protein H0H93_004315 [Arthromyces matolae]
MPWRVSTGVKLELTCYIPTIYAAGATQEDFWAAVEDADTAFGGKESLESPSHDTIPHAFKFEKTIPFKADQEDEIIIVVAKGFYYRGLGKLRDLPLKRKVTVKVEEASSHIFPGLPLFL